MIISARLRRRRRGSGKRSRRSPPRAPFRPPPATSDVGREPGGGVDDGDPPTDFATTWFADEASRGCRSPRERGVQPDPAWTSVRGLSGVRGPRVGTDAIPMETAAASAPKRPDGAGGHDLGATAPPARSEGVGRRARGTRRPGRSRHTSTNRAVRGDVHDLRPRAARVRFVADPTRRRDGERSRHGRTWAPHGARRTEAAAPRSGGSSTPPRSR
jgi:hypothetical protein